MFSLLISLVQGYYGLVYLFVMIKRISDGLNIYYLIEISMSVCLPSDLNTFCYETSTETFETSHVVPDLDIVQVYKITEFYSIATP